MASTLTLNVNGVNRSVTVSSPDMPLLWVLRDVLGMTGTKYGCGIEVCGACTVLIDNQREHSCVFNVSSAVGKKIVTVEGLSADEAPRKDAPVTIEAMTRAAHDYLPSRDVEMLEFMELLAVFEASNRRMLPPKYAELPIDQLQQRLQLLKLTVGVRR